ncbi:MAG TPA: SRPBCC domain-containing protein [Solirubrobacterales bacterium]|nr:SRPBCC domain-containing protein [Solirubrobacterales bacterium]
MAKEFECERDGVVIRGADDGELVASVERHIAAAHPDLVGKVYREDILAAAGDGLTLRLKRVVPFTRTVVYRALSDPEELAKWWGPRGFTVPSVEFDPRVGGSYRIAMQPPDGDLFYLSGAFLEVDPPAGLTYTFRWDPPDPDDRETVATLYLEDRGERTEVLLTQGEFATEERLGLHEGGWIDSLGRLREVLGGAPD